MPQNQNNQMPLVTVPGKRRNVSAMVAGYVMAFVRIALALVLAVLVGAFAVIAIWAVMWAAKMVLDALGG